MLEVIKVRRSIRKFKTKEVSKENIEEILKAGILAPSSKNRQPWRFTVVAGDAYEQYCDWIDLDSVDLSYFDKDELNELLLEELEDIQNAYENPDFFE